MNDITPSETQQRAITDIKRWFENDTARQQVFRLFGYAGTGKSTITALAIQALGLDPMSFLENNDAHALFEALGDQVITGPTHTNVNDFRGILIR